MKIFIGIFVASSIIWIALVGLKVFVFPLMSQNQFYSKGCTADTITQTGWEQDEKTGKIISTGIHIYKITNLVCK